MGKFEKKTLGVTFFLEVSDSIIFFFKFRLKFIDVL